MSPNVSWGSDFKCAEDSTSELRYIMVQLIGLQKSEESFRYIYFHLPIFSVRYTV